jgi:hypothetical protein
MYETVSTTTRGRILLPMPPASAPATASAHKPDRTHYLYLSVIAAVVLGIVVGLVAPALGKAMQPLGTAFIALIKMMISPIIFCTIVLGIGKIRKAAQVGKVGAIALGYFVAMSTVALAIGLLVGNIIQPGAGLNISGLAHYQVPAAKAEGDFLLGIIPTTLFSPLVGDNVLSTLFVALLVGFALQAMGRTGEPVLRAVGYVEKLVFRVLAHDHVGRPDRRVRRDRRRGRRDGLGALGALAPVMLASTSPARCSCSSCSGSLLRSSPAQHLLAAALPGPGVPADRVDLVVGVGAAAADREDGARRRLAARSSASRCRPATRSTSTAPRST